MILNRCFPCLENGLDFAYEFIDEPRNVLTLLFEIHRACSGFQTAFEATDTPHTYRLKQYHPEAIPLSLPSTVTSQQHDSLYQLPSRELLEIHSTVAQILHDCGEADVIYSELQGYSENAVLRKDGTTDLAALLAVFT